MPRAACRSEVLHAGPAGDHEPGTWGTAMLSVPPSTILGGVVGVGVVEDVVEALPVDEEHAPAPSRAMTTTTSSPTSGRRRRLGRSERGRFGTDHDCTRNRSSAKITG